MRSSLARLALLLVGACGATPVDVLDTRCTMGGETPRRADEVADLLGVNTFLHYADQAYDDDQAVERSLVSLGVRHVLDYARSPKAIDVLKRLGTLNAPIKATIQLDPEGVVPNASRCAKGARCTTAADLAARLGNALEAVQLFDRFPDSADIAAPWDVTARAWASETADALQASPQVDIVGPQLAQLADYAKLGALDPRVDQGTAPSRDDPRSLTADLDEALGKASGPYRAGTPLVLSTGLTVGNDALSEAAQAEHLARLWLELARPVPGRPPIRRLFVHQLVDAIGASGLTHAFTPRKSYSFLKGLLSVFSDPAPPAVLQPLVFTLKVDGAAPAPLRHLLLQHSTGHLLVLWQDRAGEPPTAKVGVTIDLPPGVESLVLIDKLTGAGDVDLPDARTHHIDVPDHPIVLRMTASSCR